MNARPIRFSDLKSINKFRNSHKQAQIAWHELPAIGFAVPGVAFGCLRVCEGGLAIVDSLITNPLCSSVTRHKALEAIYDKLLSTPGFHTIIGFTTDLGALERAKTRGFKKLPHAILSFSKE